MCILRVQRVLSYNRVLKIGLKTQDYLFLTEAAILDTPPRLLGPIEHSRGRVTNAFFSLVKWPHRQLKLEPHF